MSAQFTTTKDSFNQGVRELFLQRTRRLLKLLKNNAPENIISNEINLLYSDLPAFDTEYKKFVSDRAEKDIAAVKIRFGLCKSSGCYNSSKKGQGGLCKKCHGNSADYEAFFQELVKRVEKTHEEVEAV